MRHYRKLIQAATKGFRPKARRKQRFVVAMPMYRSPHPKTIHCFQSMLDGFLRKNNGVELVVHRIASSGTYYSRGVATAAAIQHDCDGLFMVDDDMLWPEGKGGFNALERLSSLNLPVVAGLAFKRQMPTAPYPARLVNGHPQIIEDRDLYCKSDPFECDFVGAGMIFVQRDVLRDVTAMCGGDPMLAWNHEFTWHHNAAERRNLENIMEEVRSLAPKEAGERVARELLAIQRRSEMSGEDYSFCQKARECGYGIWVDPSFELLHIGDYAYGLRDWLHQVDSQEATKKEAANA